MGKILRIYRCEQCDNCKYDGAFVKIWCSELCRRIDRHTIDHDCPLEDAPGPCEHIDLEKTLEFMRKEGPDFFKAIKKALNEFERKSRGEGEGDG